MKVVVTTSDGQRIEPISSSSVMSKPKPSVKSGRFGTLKVRVSGIPEKEKKEEVQQEQPVETKVVEESHTEEVKSSDKVEVPEPIETKQSETVKKDKVKEPSKKIKTEPAKLTTLYQDENIKVVGVESQEIVPPEPVSADTKPAKKSTKTASKAKIAKGAKVSSSKSSVKSNFIESKE